MSRMAASSSTNAPAATPKKQWLTIAACVASLLVLGWVISGTLSGNALDPAAASRSLTLIDTVTGEVFTSVSAKEGAIAPYENPKTGKRTLVPPEACYWTRDGKAKIEPTLVVLNSFAGKPGPTICPDCGREVVRHNPMPPDTLMLKAYDEEEAKKKAGK